MKAVSMKHTTKSSKKSKKSKKASIGKNYHVTSHVQKKHNIIEFASKYNIIDHHHRTPTFTAPSNLTAVKVSQHDIPISISVKEKLIAATDEDALHLNSPDHDERNNAEAGATRRSYRDLEHNE